MPRAFFEITIVHPWRDSVEKRTLRGRKAPTWWCMDNWARNMTKYCWNPAF